MGVRYRACLFGEDSSPRALWRVDRPQDMRPTRQMFFYIAMLIVGGLAIFVILYLGSSLQVSARRVATVSYRATPATLQEQTAAVSPLQGLRTNLGHPLSHLFMQLLVVVAAARLVGSVLMRFGMPVVVGEMAAGILLGPSLLGLIAPAAFAFVFPADSLDALKLLSEVGICLFMFCVGIDLNVKEVRSMAQSAVGVSHTSIVVPFLLGVALAYLLFRDMAGERANFNSFALFMGISMSITAFPVLAHILQERGLEKTTLGNTAIACAAVEDVTAWSIMAFVVAAASASGTSGAILSLLLEIVFIAIMSFGVRRALPHWLGRERLMAEEPSGGTLTIVVCVAIAAAFSTEVIGIHALFGAFLAGAIMPEAIAFRARIRARVEIVSSAMLLPLFFAFTGLRTQLSLLPDVQGWLLCLLIIVVATVGKLGAGAVAARLLVHRELARITSARRSDQHARPYRTHRPEHRI